MHRIVTAFAVAALLLGPAVLSAQEPPAGEVTEQIEVTEVLLDVLVTDRDGNVILGLQPEDFVVEVEGQSMPVLGATFYSNRRFLESSGAAEQLGVDPKQVPDRRYFIFLFDDQRAVGSEAPQLLPRQLDAARRARTWIDQEMLPGDWVAVASWYASLRVQQDFTQDRKALRTAIDAAAVGSEPSGNWPSRQEAAAGVPSLRAGLPSGTALRNSSANFHEALRMIAEASGSVVGRKNLVLFSEGFGDLNPVGTYIPDQRYYPRLLQALNANNVAVYALDLTPTATEHSLTHSLHQLAHETGGAYYFNEPNFTRPLNLITRENNGYYLLAFRGTAAGARPEYHRVTVSCRNPEFRVKSREGFRTGSQA